MVTTTASVFWNDETEKVLFKLNWWKTALWIIMDYYGLRHDELQNSKRLKQLWVKWLPRIWELWCTQEQFNILFGDVIDYDTEWSSTKSNSPSITWTEWTTSVSSNKRGAKKSS